MTTEESDCQLTTDVGVPFGFHFEKSSAREFVDYFLSNEWHSTFGRFEATGPGMAGWIYRGQSNSTLPLMPTGFRQSTDWGRFTDQPPSGECELENRHNYLAIHLHAERRAVHLFMDTADRLGIATPIDYRSTNKQNKVIQKMLDGEKLLPACFPSEKQCAAFALAQHHGVPTRLLDWTESPLIAAYFAALGVHGKGDISDDTPRIGVFFMRVNEIQSSVGGSRPIELVQVPRHENTYLLQQRGIFTNIQNANDYFVNEGRWPSLNDVLAGRSSPQLHCVTLPASEASELLRILFDHNISPVRLQPTLDKVAASFEYTASLFDQKSRVLHDPTPMLKNLGSAED